ncbi:MAG: discoidin domain-containing protein, partial [Planctomycetota bacterium]
SDTATKARITLDAKTIHGQDHDPDGIEESITLSPGENHFEMTYDMGQACLLWDEFSPNVYQMKATVLADDSKDEKTVSFGMRQFKAGGTQFVINGRKLFLRGTLECCIFPLTGYPPTDINEWARIIKVAQSHGLNHFRFHSWCPPRAAFEAADKLGFYFQVEGPVWGTVGDGDPVDDYIYTECERILKEYGNHPSFVMMAYGNEPWGDNHEAYLNKLVKHLKAIDARHLYTAASGWAHVPQNQYHSDYKPRVQLWNANLTSRINALPPETVTDYRDFVAKSKVPIVSHEIGQWCAYPNYKEMKKYTGVVKPKNFEIFKQMLIDNHMLDQADDFLMASGKLQVLCYKEDIESALRTPGFGGFQLLDLHDFPGQGTALVGVLDPFWDPKPYVSADQYRRFCGQTVPLARMGKRIWTDDETFTADLEIAHFGPKPIEDATVSWKITEGKKIYASGNLIDQTIGIGSGKKLAGITASLQDVKAPAMLNLEVAIDGTEFANDWDLWVYPETRSDEGTDIAIVNTFDEHAVAMLESGKTVMLMPAPGMMKGNIPPGFSSIFWNTLWTNGQQPHTLGILCDPDHPALADFPTQYHSNWQWWDIITKSQAMIMDDLPPTLRPIVQVIDDWFSNRRLGIVFEARVNGSKLLICSVDLQTDIEKRPVAKQFLDSLKKYMDSEAFDPGQELTTAQVNSLFRSGTLMKVVAADSQAPGYPASNAVDEDPKTFWHTPWSDEPAPYPHELVIDLKATRTIIGIGCLTRQDGLLTGCVKEYEVYLSDQPDTWGQSAAKGQFTKDDQRQTVLFDKSQTGRYLRFVAAGGFDDSAYAAIAELEVITEQE